ncbi:MAG: hypothetical protein WA117_02560 [Verrucomicrobiia bacterium]
MVIVPQITCYTCVLACLESVLKDQGISFSQEGLIEKFPAACQKGTAIEGAVDFSKLTDLVKELGFNCCIADLTKQRVANRFPLLLLEARKQIDGGYLLATRHWKKGDNQKHCVRLKGVACSGDGIEVMNPNPGVLEVWSEQDVIDRDCFIIRMEKRQ